MFSVYHPFESVATASKWFRAQVFIFQIGCSRSIQLALTIAF
jgi:hypothetical protein